MTQINLHLYDKQGEFCFNPHKLTAIEGSTKSGKTYALICWLISVSFPTTFKDNLNWWISPNYSMAENAFNQAKKIIRDIGIPKTYVDFTNSKGNQSIKFKHTNNVVEFKSADNIDSLYGFSVNHLVVDEASRTPEDLLAVCLSVTAATKGIIKLIGNVKDRNNWFYKFCRSVEQGSIPNSKFFSINCEDAITAQVVSREDIEQRRNTLSDWEFKRDYLNIPPDSGLNPFGIDNIDNLIIPFLPKNKTPICFGIDVARGKHSKDDYTSVIGINDEGIVCELHHFKGPWKLQIEKIKAIITSTPSLIEINSYGSVIFELLQDECNLFPFTTTSTSKKTLIESVLSPAILSAQIKIPACFPIIIDELKRYELEETRTNYTYNAGSGHDDTVISLALAIHKYKELEDHTNIEPTFIENPFSIRENKNDYSALFQNYI